MRISSLTSKTSCLKIQKESGRISEVHLDWQRTKNRSCYSSNRCMRTAVSMWGFPLNCAHHVSEHSKQRLYTLASLIGRQLLPYLQINAAIKLLASVSLIHYSKSYLYRVVMIVLLRGFTLTGQHATGLSDMASVSESELASDWYLALTRPGYKQCFN